MKIAFLHVPKTAGTTVHKIISDQGLSALFYPPHFKDESQKPFASTFDHFLTMEEKPIDELNTWTAIGGHTDIRLIDYLIEPRYLFTVFRNPFDRLVSYYFHEVHPEKEHHFRRYREETSGMNFADFLRFEPLIQYTDNKFTRFFSGKPLVDRVTEKDFEAAAENLEKLDAILIQGDLDDNLGCLARDLGWKIDEIPFQKKGQKRQTLGESDIRRADALEQLHWDEKLYALAQRLNSSWKTKVDKQR